jgi:hypothetical protein
VQSLFLWRGSARRAGEGACTSSRPQPWRFV